MTCKVLHTSAAALMQRRFAAVCAARERRACFTALALVFAAHLSLYPLFLVRRTHMDK